MTTALTPLLLATALGVWPANPARRRLRALRPSTRRPLRPPPLQPLIPPAAALLAWPLLGPAGALATLLLAILTRAAIRKRRKARDEVEALDALAECLRSLVAELRAGTNPVVAVESAAEDAPPGAAEVLRSAAAAARLGGTPDIDDGPGGQIVQAWHLAHHHGLPLAGVLDSVRLDLEQRARFARQVDARMAGPRASAAVLACLPVVAVLLGQVSGADPVAVLADTSLGQVLLLVGAALAGAGLRWTEHLTRVGAP
ncbi:type II secretion system F family protein [Actinokineospora soli]|uniref:Type II secretion system F family protein n=1 Tax=Actinokineospora soli TaxID=1048753 RepID=A0ABW2TH24_9PSEU